MGLKAAVQALKKAEPLKDKVQRCKDLLNDNDAWMCQRQLQKIYQQVLILDLEYALDRKVEQELWNLGFKNYIALLQSQAKDRRNPKQGESQVMLGWCLEAASGFYLTLLQEICTAFDLDLPFRRKSYVYGCISPWKAVENLSAPHKSSCFYACQYCLVHLGDIARYRNQNKQAELFYRHAVSLSPSSGQPYNQLALLEASRGDKLGTVFHYVRSVSVKHPFPVASSNLSKTLSSALNDLSFNIERKTKLSSQEYILVFLKLHGVLYNLGDLSIAATYIKLMNDALTALVATESFSSWRLVQMLVINLYALQHTAGVIAENAELMKTDQLSADEMLSKNCILDLIAGSLSALLLPVYTIKNALINYLALPTIKLCLDWIQQRPTILEEGAFTSRPQIWPSLCVLLNGLQSCVTADLNCNQYAKVPLPEDRDLQGFLPLEKSFELLEFKNTYLENDIALLNKLRAMRILQIGRQIAQYQVQNGAATLISLAVDENEKPKFVSASEGIGLDDELIKELEELSLNKEKNLAIASSPVPSESASSKGSLEIESLIAFEKLPSSILKPQGSLERNRDFNDGGVENNSLPSSARRPRQNVAMQAIMRRAETEQKQVTFKNISPVMKEETELIKTVIVTSSVSPVKTSSRDIVLSAAAAGSSNSIVNNESIELGQPLMSNALLHIKSVSTVQQQQLQLESTEQHLEQHQLDNHLSNVLLSPEQQQRENMILPSSSIGQQFSHADLQISMIQGPRNRFSQQQQQQGQISQNTAYYSNQSFNAQTPLFNKNLVANSSTSLQQHSVAASMPEQFGSGQTPGAISFSSNMSVNQNRLIQQQQRGNFSSLSQGTCMLNQALNLSPSAQQKQSTGQNFNMPQNLSIYSSNLVTSAPRPSNGSNWSNLANMVSYQVGLPKTSISNSTVPLPSIQQQQLQQSNFPSSNFSQNNFTQLTQQTPQKQISPTAYGNRQEPQQQQQQFNNYPNPTTLKQKNQSQQPQQLINNHPTFHGSYDTKDFNLWKDQPPQPPMAWWGNKNMVAAGQIMQHQQQLDNELPMVASNTDGFQNWANWSSRPAQRMNSVLPLTPSNSYPPQGRLFVVDNKGRSNLDEMRSFEVNQQTQSQSAAMGGSTYSLFSSNNWGANGQLLASTSHQNQIKARLSQQSLWSGPGPSPLERLLEQQKSLREGGT